MELLIDLDLLFGCTDFDVDQNYYIWDMEYL